MIRILQRRPIYTPANKDAPVVRLFMTVLLGIFCCVLTVASIVQDNANDINKCQGTYLFAYNSFCAVFLILTAFITEFVEAKKIKIIIPTIFITLGIIVTTTSCNRNNNIFAFAYFVAIIQSVINAIYLIVILLQKDNQTDLEVSINMDDDFAI